MFQGGVAAAGRNAGAASVQEDDQGMKNRTVQQPGAVLQEFGDDAIGALRVRWFCLVRQTTR